MLFPSMWSSVFHYYTILMDDIYLRTHFHKQMHRCDIVTIGCGLCTFPDAISPVGFNGECNCGPTPPPPPIPGDIWQCLGILLVFWTWGAWASLVAQLIKTLPAMQETWVQFLGWEDPLEKVTATQLEYSSPENSMGCIVPEVTKSQTWQRDFHFHYQPGKHASGQMLLNIP